jgi:hypothetical protein
VLSLALGISACSLWPSGGEIPPAPNAQDRLGIFEAMIRHLANPDGPQPIFVDPRLCTDLMPAQGSRCPDRFELDERRELSRRLSDLGRVVFDEDPPVDPDQSFQNIILGPIVPEPDGYRVEGGAVCGGLCGSGAVFVVQRVDDGFAVTGTDDRYGQWIA